MRNKGEKRSRAEMLSLGVSLLLLSGLVTGILYVGLSAENLPARFRIEKGEIMADPDGFYLNLSIINEGDETGRKVKVAGILRGERRSTVIDHLPGHSEERVVLIFRAYPEEADIFVESYQRP